MTLLYRQFVNLSHYSHIATKDKPFDKTPYM
jgi:hypothetical protein